MNKIDNHAIACVVVNNNNQVLLLKRSPNKKLFPEKWFVVGAYPLAENTDFEKKALEEVEEETGIKGKILKKGKPYMGLLNSENALIHPFLTYVISGEVTLNYEHTEYKWVDSKEINTFDIVYGANEMITSLINQ